MENKQKKTCPLVSNQNNNEISFHPPIQMAINKTRPLWVSLMISILERQKTATNSRPAETIQ